MDRSDLPYSDAVRFLLDRINYEKSSNRPYNQQNYKLARMEALLARLGNPQLAAPVVHVAGSKGKGSVSWFIAEAARHAGYRVGLYTSPHLEFLEERFIFNGATITPKELVEAVETLQSALHPGCLGDHGEPTFFELTTAIAWMLFQARKTQLNVMEVGLGGRLDSTNVCDSTLSVITSINFDHQAQLGNTIALIAREKAGIIKPNRSVICGARHLDAKGVVREVAHEKKSSLWEIGREFDCLGTPPSQSSSGKNQLQYHSWSPTAGVSPMKDVDLRMLGNHQADNGAIAIAACQKLTTLGLKIPEASIRHSLETVQVPCRVQVFKDKPTVILDTAHNVASIQSLIETLKSSFAPSRRTVLFACSKDKEYEAMLELLMGYANRLILTQYESNPRFVPVERLESLAKEMHPRFPKVELFFAPRPAIALSYAVKGLEASDLLAPVPSFWQPNSNPKSKSSLNKQHQQHEPNRSTNRAETHRSRNRLFLCIA
jgi:dihydrofolate synthase / folylpolyglutamate synthase